MHTKTVAWSSCMVTNLMLLGLDNTILAQVCGGMFCHSSHMIILSCFLLEGFRCSILCFKIPPTVMVDTVQSLWCPGQDHTKHAEPHLIQTILFCFLLIKKICCYSAGFFLCSLAKFNLPVFCHGVNSGFLLARNP